MSRVDGVVKVTGRAKYAADTNVRGQAYGYLVLATIGRGVIRSMAVREARNAPGVLAIYTPFNPLRLSPLQGPGPKLGEKWAPLQDTRGAAPRPDHRPGRRRVVRTGT
jgi:xanthine dehydrogenase YagR molybdenum-binding subunit